jgi:hypothetical protein
MSNAYERAEIRSYTEAGLAAAATEFADNAVARGLGRLDFTYRSLRDLDAILDGVDRRGDDTIATISLATLYLGEVLVRQYGCRRGTTDKADLREEINLLYPPVDCDEIEPVDVGKVIARRLTERVSVAAQILDVASGWFTVPMARPDPDDLPALMRMYAQAFVAPAKAAGRMWLDYSPGSVAQLDEFIAEGWPRRPARGTYENMIPTIGAYVGEVLVAEAGAVWVKDRKEGFGVALGGVTAWPMNKVGKRFALGERHSLGHFYREVSSHWRSGNDTVPVTWRGLPDQGKGRGLRLFGRR